MTNNLFLLMNKNKPVALLEENRAFAPFRRDDKWAVKISQIDVEEIVADLREYWSNYIADVGAIKIPIGGVDVDDIIDKYFKKRFINGN